MPFRPFSSRLPCQDALCLYSVPSPAEVALQGAKPSARPPSFQFVQLRRADHRHVPGSVRLPRRMPPRHFAPTRSSHGVSRCHEIVTDLPHMETSATRLD
jgi:hypothetical protein